MNIRDLRGQRFGRLSVIDRTNQKHGNCYLWRCLCDCGKEALVSTYSLTSGTRKSCGCLATEPKVDLKGMVFGRLTVVDCTGLVRHGGFVWECRCECGNTVFVATSQLKSGVTRSCGCLHIDLARVKAPTINVNNHIDGTNIGAIKSDKIPENNTSGVKGVSWHCRFGKWQSRITFRGQTIHLGYYDNIADAAQARKQAEEQYFGEYLADK